MTNCFLVCVLEKSENNRLSYGGIVRNVIEKCSYFAKIVDGAYLVDDI